MASNVVPMRPDPATIDCILADDLLDRLVEEDFRNEQRQRSERIVELLRGIDCECEFELIRSCRKCGREAGSPS